MSTLQAKLWADVLANPFLKDLPFKIEMNRWGRIEMSPASNQHGLVQVDVAAELRQRPGGRVLVECSIATTDGVRVADVAWITDARLLQYAGATPYPHLGRDAHEGRPVPAGRRRTGVDRDAARRTHGDRGLNTTAAAARR
jgi:hypothetical protein